MPVSGVQVDICGVECTTGAPSSDGCEWIVTEVSGWDSPDQRFTSLEPTGRHGAATSVSMFGARIVTVTVAVFAGGSRANGIAAYYRASGAMPGLNAEGDYIVYEEDAAKMLRVAQGAPPRVNSPDEVGDFTFQLTLRADYPQKRALTPTTVAVPAGGSATFAVGGNFAAEVEVELTGAGTVALTSYGATLATTSLPAGSVLKSIDRTIVDDSGADAFSTFVAGSQWLAASPGSNTFTNSGTAPVLLTVYDTYA